LNLFSPPTLISCRRHPHLRFHLRNENSLLEAIASLEKSSTNEEVVASFQSGAISTFGFSLNILVFAAKIANLIPSHISHSAR
jgi:tRNA(Ile)-lysidine synthase TilS/MesJ